MFLGVTEPVLRRQQIVDTVSAAPLEPTRPARPYRRAPPGIHLHALHPHFPCVFVLSRYEGMDHGAVHLQENLPRSDLHPPSMVDGAPGISSVFSASARMQLLAASGYLRDAERKAMASMGRTPP